MTQFRDVKHPCTRIGVECKYRIPCGIKELNSNVKLMEYHNTRDFPSIYLVGSLPQNEKFIIYFM